MLRAERVSGLTIKQGGPNRRSLRSRGRRREEKADKKNFPVIGFFLVYIT
jgi:hypothetical protein